MHILGVFGPWQLTALLLLFVLPAILIPVLIVTSVKRNRKSKAQTLDKVMTQTATRDDNMIEKLEKLNRLRESGGLTEVEYSELKKKLM